MQSSGFVERRIIIGMVVSTEFLQGIRPSWNPTLLIEPTAKEIAGWCISHFDKYGKAPGQDIEGIYAQKLKAGLPQEKAEWIEDVLDSLADEYDRESFNLQYALDQAKAYFRERHLQNHAKEIKGALEAGDALEAERLATGYSPVVVNDRSAIDPFSDKETIERAFAERAEPLIKWPKALGKFWNPQWTRGAFVAFMGPEKSGKTFWLNEVAMRGMRAGRNVAFFQAGDMSEPQQIRRQCIWLAKRSDLERYCQGMWVPVPDCVHNQLDECDKDERECDFGLWKNKEKMEAGQTLQVLEELYQQEPDYRPCTACPEYQRHGAVWIKWRKPAPPLTSEEAWKIAQDWSKKCRGRMKLSTHANETLTIGAIKAYLDIWERQDGFVPDIIVIDYMDILAPDPDISRMQPRDQYNKIWQRARALSQDRNCLVVSATQANAKSYDAKLLTRGNFSEDKRKFAHVTAMWGLNQTPIEKQIGVQRLNDLVLREDDFNTRKTVKVLQRLQMGRPLLGSFF